MLFKNNSFTGDSHEEHNQRVKLCAIAVVEHAATLGLRDTWVTGVVDHADNFAGLLDNWNIEDADWHGAIADLAEKRLNLYMHNASARWMVHTILDDPALPRGLKQNIDDAFDIDKPLVSKAVVALAKATRALLSGQGKLVEAGAEWKLPDDVVTNLTNGLAAMELSLKTSKNEHGEKLAAMENIYEAREAGERILRNIFRWVVAVWGDDDPRLLEFGFVPKSQIWTEGQPEPGAPELPEWPGPIETLTAEYLGQGVVEVKYSSVQEATRGIIEYTEANMNNWQMMFDNVDMNPEDIVALRILHIMPGDYEIRFTPFRDGEAGEQSIIELHIPV